MRIGKASRAYRAAEQGSGYDPPDALTRRIRGVPDAEAVVARALAMVLEARHHSANERGFDAPNAWEYLQGVSRTEEEHHALLRIVIYLARKDIRWWVDDPEKQGYCADCRRRLDLELFSEDRWKCRRCDAKA